MARSLMKAPAEHCAARVTSTRPRRKQLTFPELLVISEPTLLDLLPDNIFVVATVNDRIHLTPGVVKYLSSFDALSKKDVARLRNKLNPRARTSCEIELAIF